MDTTGSTPSPYSALAPLSPMTPPLTSTDSGDSMFQSHGRTTTSATSSQRSGYNSGYHSASGYVTEGAGGHGDSGSPSSSNSPNYGNRLVHRSNRGINTRGMTEQSAQKHRSTSSMGMANEDPYGNDGENKLVTVLSRSPEFHRRHLESEQRRRDGHREDFARLKDVLQLADRKASRLVLLDQATSQILELEAMQRQMHVTLTTYDIELNRLQLTHEALRIKAAERRSSQSSL